MRITAEDVRSLLDSELPAPTLVLHEGKVRLIGEDELDSRRYAGALVVAARDSLREQLGDKRPAQRELEEVAARLEVGVSNQGG